MSTPTSGFLLPFLFFPVSAGCLGFGVSGVATFFDALTDFLLHSLWKHLPPGEVSVAIKVECGESSGSVLNLRGGEGMVTVSVKGGNDGTKVPEVTTTTNFLGTEDVLDV